MCEIAEYNFQQSLQILLQLTPLFINRTITLIRCCYTKDNIICNNFVYLRNQLTYQQEQLLR